MARSVLSSWASVLVVAWSGAMAYASGPLPGRARDFGDATRRVRRPRPDDGSGPSPSNEPHVPAASAADIHILFHTDLFGRFRAPGCNRPTSQAPHFGRLIGAIRALRARIEATGAAPPIVVSTGNLLGPDVLGQFSVQRAR